MPSDQGSDDAPGDVTPPGVPSQEADVMDSNLRARYLAVQIRQSRLSVQAERGWLIDQVVAAQPHRSRIARMRRWIGASLIFAGERMQGSAEPVPGGAGPARQPASTQP